MALDRFVRWRKDRPLFDDIKKALEDYLGDACTKVVTDDSVIFATLVGKPRCPFRRLGEGDVVKAMEQRDERFLEVYVSKKYIDVITRQTDEFTNVVAEGFAQLCARYWQGKRDPE